MSAAIASVLEAGKFQLITKDDVADAEFLLARGAIDAAILDVELTDARASYGRSRNSKGTRQVARLSFIPGRANSGNGKRTLTCSACSRC